MAPNDEEWLKFFHILSDLRSAVESLIFVVVQSLVQILFSTGLGCADVGQVWKRRK